MGGRKVSDPRTTKHWVIKVNGSTKVDVGPGENVEIGRRPLRPLSDDGHRRLEIDDDTRSMSKRHAVFTVAANGGASLTDLNSTNGSYVVDEKGLRPLTPNQDFILPDSPMRLQFGDVPVDFVRVEVDESPESGNQVTDLFDYAASGGENTDIEPDLNEMSVDDILNLRAGEPTTAFSAADVANRIGVSATAGRDGKTDSHNISGQAANDNGANADDLAGETPLPVEAGAGQNVGEPQVDHAIDQISLNVMTPDSQAEDSKARDLFKDAMTSVAEDKAEEPGRLADAGNKVSQPAANDTAVPLENISSSAGLQTRQVSLPSRRNNGQRSQKTGNEQQPMGSPIAAQSQPNMNGAGVRASNDHGNLRAGAGNNINGDADNTDADSNGTVSADEARRRTDNGINGFSAFGQTPVDQDTPVFVAMDGDPRQSEGGGARPRLDFSGSQNSQNDSAQGKTAEERNKFMPPIRDVADSPMTSGVVNGDDGLSDAQQGFKPAFEPGSVFEKVSNGEFDQPQPEVEVEGMSSQDAKATTDFSLQFEMAKHPELLPFLAMNPSLYDDLYAWLSAVGNDDIDAALSYNSGYIEYCKEVGEGRKQ